MKMRSLVRAAAVMLALSLPLAAWAANDVRVALDDGQAQAVSGRLLVFAVPVDEAKALEKDGKLESIDSTPFRPTLVSVAAREVTGLAPGASIGVDTDAIAYPAGFSSLKPGDYFVQVVLDQNHDYNYGGRGAGDIVSEVTRVHWPADSAPLLKLVRTLPVRHHAWELSPRMAGTAAARHIDEARAHAKPLDFVSPALSAFWGRDIHMRGWVLLPPDYDHAKHDYPVVYFTHGFGGQLDYLASNAAMYYGWMAEGQTPPMIYVFLDESSPTGTHEFADSVNNGPWGKALTTELIPWLEQHYRMDARVSSRFLTGHSSGGWATLWLQVEYPKVFGSTWSTSPDPSDFHDFTGVDLYAPDANAYHRPDGSAYPLMRANGKVVATFEQFARLERVIGPYGGQLASFEWVFSPRGADGRPMQMFDRDSGAVNPKVVAYWRDHYDIAHKLQTQWPQLKPDLDGKIHLIVGDADTFYLNGAAHRLKTVLDGLGAKAEVRFIPGRSHFDLFRIGDDRYGLAKQIAWDMYKIARPGSTLKPVKAPAAAD